MRRVLLVLLILATGSLLPASAAARGLTAAPELATVYGHILNADFDAAESALAEARSVAPAEACDVLALIALWWRIQLDPQDRSHDERFEAAAAAAIDAAAAWTEREPARAEAWFYLGGAYAARARLLVLREHKMTAARDGKRIKEALERALELEPTLEDAHFGIGLYQYYADVAPTAAKLFRWLLLLPGGDRVEGLQRMLRTRDRGALLGGEADYQLHLLYLWYESKPKKALALLDGLAERYPGNPLFPLQIARVQDVYFQDTLAAAQTYRQLLARAQDGNVNAPGVGTVEARLGLARALDALSETDRAIELLRSIVEEGPREPYLASGRAQLQLGAAYDRLGQRRDAARAYRAAIRAVPEDDPFGVRLEARDRLHEAPDGRAAEAYRLSLDGWRALERLELTDAQESLERARTLAPDDPVIAYRHARLLIALDRDAEALRELEHVLAARPLPHPAFVGAAYLHAARLHEQHGERARAIEGYEAAAAVRNGGAETHAAAQRALARLHATTRGR